MTRLTKEFILRKVNIDTVGWCWIWPSSDGAGYPIARDGGVVKRVHRASYEAFIGPIQEGLVVDHLCRNRSCVNPSHLEAVTIAENVRRGAGSNKTHCINGHLFTKENTFYQKDRRRNSLQRSCRICRANRFSRYRKEDPNRFRETAKRSRNREQYRKRQSAVAKAWREKNAEHCKEYRRRPENMAKARERAAKRRAASRLVSGE